MKIAIICSAGGSAFFAAFDILVQTNRFSSENFIVITDRACQAEQNASDRGIFFKRVEFESKENFSKTVLDILIKKQVSTVLMLYSRLVSSDLYLHLTTEKVDDGQIIGQVSSPFDIYASKSWIDKLSFLQKTYLIIMFIDALQTGLLKISKKGLVNYEGKVSFSASANPSIQSNDLNDLFSVYQAEEKMQGAIQ
jgi:phosphoribosylglycinamide formyltransferase 1